MPVHTDAANVSNLPAERGLTPAASTAIPAETPAEHSTQPAELTYRQNAEAQPGTPAEASAPQQPVSVIPSEAEGSSPSPAASTAIPTESPAEQSIQSAVLTYRAETETLAEQSIQPAEPAYREQAETPSAPLRPLTSGDRAIRPLRPTPQTARDIRMTAEHPRRPFTLREDRSPAQTAHGSAPAEAQTAALIPPAAPDETDLTAGPLPAALPGRETEGPVDPPELFFAAQPVGAQPPAEPSAVPPAQQSGRPEALPSWAKELLEQSGVTDTVKQSAVFHGRSAASETRQITWTAPGLPGRQNDTAPGSPAGSAFRERGAAEEPSPRKPVSDAELQRTADKVYKIIEERLRRELRRSGR